MVAVSCKLCSKYIEKIQADNTLKFVKKGNINRYLASAGHKIALSNESISANKNVNGNAPKRGQICIETSLKEPMKLAYKNFLKQHTTLPKVRHTTFLQVQSFR